MLPPPPPAEEGEENANNGETAVKAGPQELKFEYSHLKDYMIKTFQDIKTDLSQQM